jgi:transposase
VKPVTNRLRQKAGHDVRVINPLLAKKYSTANIRKVKTDQADAAVLAEISERERHLPPRFCLTTQDIALRQKVTLIAKLDQNLQSLQRTLGEVQRSQAELGIQAGPVQSDLKDAITKLKDNKYALEDELQKDIVAKHRGSEKKVETFDFCSRHITISSLSHTPVFPSRRIKR